MNNAGKPGPRHLAAGDEMWNEAILGQEHELSPAQPSPSRTNLTMLDKMRRGMPPATPHAPGQLGQLQALFRW
jgi:hypothetical protein